MDVRIALSDCCNKILNLVAECPEIDHEAEVASLTSEIDDLGKLYGSGDLSEEELSNERYVPEQLLRFHKHQVWFDKWLIEQRGNKD